MKIMVRLIILSLFFSGYSCNNPEPEVITGILQLSALRVGAVNISITGDNTDVPVNKPIVAEFNRKIDTSLAKSSIRLLKDNIEIPLSFNFLDEETSISAWPSHDLDYGTSYSIIIDSTLKSAEGHLFGGTSTTFTTVSGSIALDSIWFNGRKCALTGTSKDVDLNLTIRAFLSSELNTESLTSQNVKLTRDNVDVPATITVQPDNKSFDIHPLSMLEDIKKYKLVLTNDIKGSSSENFNGFEKSFYTQLDSTYKFQEITDDELLQLIERQTFKYFWDFGHPICGLARERNTSGDIVTSGGSGFGIMALVIGMERSFISRQEGLVRLGTIVTFLESADRFHGAWPHWINGSTGKVFPFSPNDNGGDLVETSYLAAGMLCARQYLNPGVIAEKNLIDKINKLLSEIEWSWYTRDGQDVLYWHWSPNLGWIMNMPVRGYNEALITYIMAATSTTYPISTDVYTKGWAQSGAITNGKEFYGVTLPLGYDYGGPLFFAHYSFLGINPSELKDQYADYWVQNVNHTLINRNHCIVNPYGYIGYSDACWGLTASDNQDGYSAHSPTNDLGVITPTAAISSIPYTPESSLKAIRFFYYILGDKLWGEYGFYDAFNPTEGWWGNSYLAIDQGPIIIMIENYRTGLCWDLLMSAPEIQAGLDKLGFTY